MYFKWKYFQNICSVLPAVDGPAVRNVFCSTSQRGAFSVHEMSFLNKCNQNCIHRPEKMAKLPVILGNLDVIIDNVPPDMASKSSKYVLM